MAENNEKHFTIKHLALSHWKTISSTAFALAICLIVFNNRLELLSSFFLGVFFSLPIIAIKGVKRPYPSRRRLLVIGTLLLSLVAVVFISADFHRFLRHIFQFLLFWLPFFLIINLRALYRLRLQLLITIISAAFTLVALHLLGPYLVHNHLLPHYEADVDHVLKHMSGFTNEDGIQPDVPPEEYIEQGLNIIVLGDSYAYGAKLKKQTDSFPFLLETKLQKRFPKANVRVANFGYPSSSPVLQARQIRKIGAKYNPDIVLQVISMTAFSDDIRFSEKLRRQHGKEKREVSIFRAMEVHASLILFAVPDYRVWLKMQLWESDSRMKENAVVLDGSLATLDDELSPDDRMSYFFHMEQPLSLSEPYMHTTWDAILQTRNYANSIGSKYVLFILPRCRQYQKVGCPENYNNPFGGKMPKSDEYLYEPFKFFEKKKKTISFPIHSLLPDFQNAGEAPTTFKDDPHFNRAGHELAAQGIVKYILEDGLIETINP